jgi:hypothetical protein
MMVLRRMSLLLALFGHRAMSELSPLCDQKGTWRPSKDPAAAGLEIAP